MATSSSFYTRSISFPSTFHPLHASIEDHFRRLRATKAGPLSLSSLCQNLWSVKELHEKAVDWIHLPHNQQVLSRENHRVEVEEVLDGSLVLLDASSSVLDALSQLKESILDLKSAFRRGSNEEGISTYVMSRKKTTKLFFKCLLSWKKLEKSSAFNKSENGSVTVRMLKDAETISLLTFKSLLSYIMGKKESSQACRWSLVGKLLRTKYASPDTKNVTELEHIDHALSALSEKNLGAGTKNLMRQLDALEMIILELGVCLELVSKCFVKSRVSLLNLLNR